MGNLASILGKISFYMIIILIFLCANYFAKFLPLFLSPIGIILSILSLHKMKNIYALLGLVINGLVFLGEFGFMIIGVKFLR